MYNQQNRHLKGYNLILSDWRHLESPYVPLQNEIVSFTLIWIEKASRKTHDGSAFTQLQLKPNIIVSEAFKETISTVTGRDERHVKKIE